MGLSCEGLVCGLSEGVARGTDALTMLGCKHTRTMFVNDLLEVWLKHATSQHKVLLASGLLLEKIKFHKVMVVDSSNFCPHRAPLTGARCTSCSVASPSPV